MVQIEARRDGALLRVRIENDVDQDLPAAGANGIGLANVRQRLAAIYGHEASVHWTRDKQQFRVVLALPFDTTEQ
jgi:two-component system, LytTR family, sensor histidine kinase AlgZ